MMYRFILCVLLLCISISCVFANNKWDDLDVPPLVDKNYTNNDVKTLNKLQRIKQTQRQKGVDYDVGMSAIDESLKWQNGNAPRPILQRDGVVRFPYGEYQPTVTCKPLNLCDIELQAGEEIQGILIGDSIRWNEGDQGVPVVYSGDASKLIPHLVLKPSQSGLETTLMVTTSKRTYMVRLRSASIGYVGRAGFYYPHEEVVNYKLTEAQIKQKNLDSVAQDVIDKTLMKGDKLNYKYVMIGKDYEWKPLKVFDDGVSVFVEMPKSVVAKNLPSICILNGNDSEHCELVNFRYIHNYYVIDKLFDRMKLMNGFDFNAETITIASDKAKTSRRLFSKLFGG